MGRPRNPKDAWLPPRVYRGKSAYEWRPKEGGAVKLCSLDARRSDVWRAYEDISKSGKGLFTVAKLIDLFLESANFKDLKPGTQDDYRECKAKLVAVFGKAPPSAVKPENVRHYMDRRGQTSRSRANRERTFLSLVYAWGYERGLVKMNPCQGVKPFKAKARDRYVQDWEYRAVYDRAPESVQRAMEIAYLCAARQGDVLELKRIQLQEEGIYICQGKTGKKQIKQWSERLRQATVRYGDIISPYVIHTQDGHKYSASGFKAMFKRSRDLALKEGAITESFTFHDLKAKGISDFEGDKRRFSGHQSISQMEKYNRKAEVVPTIGSEQSSQTRPE